MELPSEFCQRMKLLLGEAYDSFLAAFSEEPERAFRYDPEKVTEEELKEAFGDALGEPIPFAPNSFSFTLDRIGGHPYHMGGALYVQEPAAMAPVAALGEEKVTSILDLCAAPGGKSLQAARLLTEDGFLVCNEIAPARRKVLMQNLERCGEKRALVSGLDARKLPQEWADAFDLVLCDAPCSGEGMMRKSEEARSLWGEDKIRECAQWQEAILDAAADTVAPGGRLMYSTCTWSVEENEERIAVFLSRHPEFSLIRPAGVEPFSAPGIPTEGLDAALVRRFYPHLFPGEGQFLAILKKAGEKKPMRRSSESKNGKPDVNRVAVEQFLQENLVQIPQGRILFRGEDAYLAPLHPFSSDCFVSPGVLIGQVRKGRLVPHHRFFIAFADLFRRKFSFPLSSPLVSAYLSGQEIDLDGEGGFGIVYCGNTPLGGVKNSGGKGKNHYPKGLRKQNV